MQIVNTLDAVQTGPAPIVLAAGFFDGVHRGHQRVLRHAVAAAREQGGSAWVLTLDAHPLKVLQPEVAPRMLTATKHKLALFQALGIDGCILLPFTTAAAHEAADVFLQRLSRTLPGLQRILVGENWRFGRGAKGTVAMLRQVAAHSGWQAQIVDPLYEDGEPVSSTRIRRLIEAGALDAARRLLGRPYSVLGTVVSGRRIGRRLGFPTANVDPHNEVLPPLGVYAVHIPLAGRVYQGVLNRGRRPTFAGKGPEEILLEAHLVGFSGDLYGKDLEIFFETRIRDEQAFQGIDALAEQIARDARRAVELLDKKSVKKRFTSEWSALYSPHPTQQRDKKKREWSSSRGDESDR